MDIRDLDRGDLEAVLDVRNRSFGPLARSHYDQWWRMQQRSIDEGRALAVYDGKRLAGMARVNRFRQWWLGRGIPMAGVGGVVVAPEYRGRGVGRLLMTGVLRRAREQGYAVSALYPATLPLYRSLGWELAGRQQFVTVPAEWLRTLTVASDASRVDLRRVEPGDEAGVTETLARHYQRTAACGPLDWEPVEWRIEIDDEEYFAFLADDGFLGYGFEGSEGLLVSHAVADSESTLRAMLATVGSGSSITKTVRVCVAPHDPLFWLTREAPATGDPGSWWMLRLVDAAAAVAGRGFPSTVTAEVPLRLDDPYLDHNAGTYLLRVAGGVGALEPESPSRGAGALHLGPNGVAALYAGIETSTLRRSGLATGGSETDDAQLDAAFGATPYCLDYF